MNGEYQYIPQVRVLMWFWSDILRDDRVTGSIFFPEDVCVDYLSCRNKQEAKRVIEAHEKYYRAIYGRHIKKVEIINENH